MNQKHMDSISLEVYVGLKIKGEKCVVLGYVSKEKCLKNNTRCLQNRKHALLLEARAIAVEQEASLMTLKLKNMHEGRPSKVCCCVGSLLRCPGTL